MSQYLDTYGVAEARRERIIKGGIAAVLLAAIAGGILWWILRDIQEQRQIEAFIEYLQVGDYKSAYALWGCTEDHPCRDYSFEKFMEDWGPNGYGDINSVHLAGKKSCKPGIIQNLTFANGEEVLLWVSREDKTLSYAPWPGCHPVLGEVEGK